MPYANELLLLQALGPVLATLVSPFLAVYLNRRIDRAKAERDRQRAIFRVLMATRATPMHVDNVNALNMIDIEFSGPQFKNIRLAWKTYLSHIDDHPGRDNLDQMPAWGNKRLDLMVDLLFAMGEALDYDFDKVHIRKALYYPNRHAEDEEQALQIREGALRVLAGNASIKVEIPQQVPTPEDAAAFRDLRQGLAEVLAGNKVLKVERVS